MKTTVDYLNEREENRRNRGNNRRNNRNEDQWEGVPQFLFPNQVNIQIPYYSNDSDSDSD